MSRFGRTIRIYLADGSPTGIRHAELVNWTGQAIVCPRGRIGELAQWAESQRPGVYLLFGDDDDSGKPILYVGEGENVLARLQSHVKTKDFWTQAVLFTSKDENLTKSHVKYLEARVVELARAAGRVELENGNQPTMSALPRADRDAMEEFLEPLRILLAALGFNALQQVGSSVSVGAGAEAPLAKTVLHFAVAKRGIEARGASTDEGFIVFAGSRGDSELRGTLGKGYLSLREQLLADGDLVVDGGTLRVARDVVFTSPSAAAAVLAGGAYNGREAWRDDSGTSLKALEEALSTAVGEGDDSAFSTSEPA
ncbi:MAG: GIY-YIG nuclease family protein [Myxococcales bacterium]|nr:GIY-YIG nuclease family protein [Myxococcales bacterium]